MMRTDSSGNAARTILSRSTFGVSKGDAISNTIPTCFSGLVERGNVVRLGLVIAAMMRVFFAVLEQIAMQLLDVVFGERDLSPRLEEQLHRFGVTGDFLLVSRSRRFDLHIGEQPLYFTVGKFAAFHTS